MSYPLDLVKDNMIVYVGTSMYPLLRDLDVIHFIVKNTELLEVGDVILYHSKKPNKEIVITHRIISITETGIITKGDNNPTIDDILVSPSEIIGLVIFAKRGNSIVHIRNGKSGLILAKAVHMIMHIKEICITSISYPYNWISKTGIFRKISPLSMKQRIIEIQRSRGIEFHLFMGNRLVAKRMPGSTIWTILPPYKLFVDEHSLPNLNTNCTLTNDEIISI